MSEIEKIESEIKRLADKRDNILAKNFKTASSHWFTLRQQPFRSSSIRTHEYITFHRIFKKQFSELLKKEFDIKSIKVSKLNHFDVTLFFQLTNGNIYYVSLGDLRWMTTFMIRTATSFEDYTGGPNMYCNLDDYEVFIEQLRSVVK